MWQDLESRGGDSPIASTAHQIDQITGTELSPEQQKMLIEIRRKKTELLLEIQEKDAFIGQLKTHEKRGTLSIKDITHETSAMNKNSFIEEANSDSSGFNASALIKNENQNSSSSKTNFTCEVCNKVFSCKKSLRCHKYKHFKEKSFKCNKCDKTFYFKSYLLKHEEIHGEKRWKCETCGSAFFRPFELRRHCLIHTEERNYCCDECGKTFRSSHHLKVHKKMHAKQNVKFNKFNSEKPIFSFPETVSKKSKYNDIFQINKIHYICEYCKEIFSNKKILLKHIKTHNRNPEIAKLEILSKESFKNKTAESEGVPIFIDCGEPPVLKFEYLENELTQETDNQYNYATCQKIYDEDQNFETNSCSLKVTEKTVAKSSFQNTNATLSSSSENSLSHGYAQYKCRKCKISFVQYKEFKDHYKLHRQRTCTICDKIFCSPSDLKRHMKIHTGEKSYICNLCEKAYVQSNQLKRHLKTHTGERPFKCEKCNSGFFTNYDLRRHEKIHDKEIFTAASSSDASKNDSEFSPINLPTETTQNSDNSNEFGKMPNECAEKFDDLSKMIISEIKDEPCD